jgi:hypothetical protein
VRAVRRRVVHLGDTSVTLEVLSSDAVQYVVDVVLPGARDGIAAPLNVTLRLEPVGDDRWLVSGDGQPLVESRAHGHLAQLLMDEVARTLMSSCRRGLLFHAASVGWRGHIFLLPGHAGAGKSTLAASLVRRGFTLVGDEIAHIDDRDIVRSYPRPFAFKSTGLAVARRWLDFEKAGGQTLNTPLATLVPPKLIGRYDHGAAWPIAAIVFPAREVGRGFDLQPMSRAETTLGLMASLVNAQNLQQHGFADVVRLAKGVPGYRMRYSDVADITIEPSLGQGQRACKRSW